MKYLNYIFFICLSLLLSACSTKQDINISKINSLSLSNITVAGVKESYKSPISFGIGVGGMISRHVGVGINSSFIPAFSNNEDLRMQDSYYRNNISLSNLIENELKFQMNNDDVFKNKFVYFGSDYYIYLFVSKYSLENELFSSKAQLSFTIELRIVDRENKIVYEDKKDNILFSDNYIYNEEEIFYSKDALIKASNLAIRQVIARLILEMKKN